MHTGFRSCSFFRKGSVDFSLAIFQIIYSCLYQSLNLKVSMHKSKPCSIWLFKVVAYIHSQSLTSITFLEHWFYWFSHIYYHFSYHAWCIISCYELFKQFFGRHAIICHVLSWTGYSLKFCYLQLKTTISFFYCDNYRLSIILKRETLFLWQLIHQLGRQLLQSMHLPWLQKYDLLPYPLCSDSSFSLLYKITFIHGFWSSELRS